MSYDLAVWRGPRPSSDAEAATEYAARMDRLETLDPAAPEPPVDDIRAYVNSLLRRWPDITKDVGEESPWADGPLMANAVGDILYFSMVWSRCEEASEYAAQLAAKHGLVCYDPQLDTLRPAQPVAERPRRWRRWTQP